MNIAARLALEGAIQKYEALMVKIQNKYDEIARSRDFVCDRCGACCELTPNIVKPLEAVYLKQGFLELSADKQRLIIDNCIKFKKEVTRRGYPTLPEIVFPVQRGIVTAELQGIPCPLLEGKNICLLYQHRPISCRVFQCFDFSQSKWNNLLGKISSLEFQYYGNIDYILNFKNRYLCDVLLDTLYRIVEGMVISPLLH